MDFNNALHHHLNKITEKNLTAFLSTVHPSTISLILPNGKFINERQDFETFHKNWFSDPDWSMSYEVLKTVVSADMGMALLKILYKDIDPQGEPYEKRYYLSLVFQLQNGNWLLVHDQNTFEN
ncbi:nuclear transport factor 2 family protein [Tumebacillus sp. DT12]|uniref:Nuclear transport factor 2 family protein n=1 Tax=Tumebacillus lacus TaxID=2995335 RepID=A0ABT3WZX9_9BACL|nr:nuclear transport factor 2 family protein [Tumebacillus lacus]MCX7570210.1 nuclear transport factor 2 family protein [Tumebacillus lacus]